QIPSMNLLDARLQFVAPLPGRWIAFSLSANTNARQSIQPELTAHSKIISGYQPEQIRKRNFLPVHLDPCRLQARRSARHISTHIQDPHRLQNHSAAPRFCLEIQLPATQAGLLNIARNTDERKGALLILKFECDSTIIELDFPQKVTRAGGLFEPARIGISQSPRMLASRRRRQPIFQVPTAICVSHSDQTRTR